MTTESAPLHQRAMLAAVATVAATAGAFVPLEGPAAAYCEPTAATIAHRSVGNHLGPRAAALNICVPRGNEQG